MSVYTRIGIYLLGVAVLVLTFGTMWSIGETKKDCIQINLAQYHRGTFNFETVRDPQDKSSEALYHFVRLIDLEAQNAHTQQR